MWYRVVGLVFTVLIAPWNSAQAQFFDESALTDTIAYQKTLELCSRITPQTSMSEELQGVWDTLQLIGEGARTGVQVWRADSLELSKPTEKLLHSEGFQAALDECYGPIDSSTSSYIHHKAFTVALIAADGVGHIFGVVSWMIPFSIFSKILLASRWAIANPGAVRVGGMIFSGARRIGLLALLGYVGWDAYHSWDIRKNSYQYLEKYNDSMVDATHQEVDATYVLVEKSLADVNAEISKGVKDPARLNYLLSKKAALEQRLRARNSPPPPDPLDTPSSPDIDVVLR